MRTYIAILAGAAAVGLSGPAIAHGTAKHERVTLQERAGMFKAADVNSDATLSREEFMNFDPTAWQTTKQNSAKRIALTDVNATYRPGTVPSAIPGEPRTAVKP